MEIANLPIDRRTLFVLSTGRTKPRGQQPRPQAPTFAGVIFAVSLERSSEPSHALGVNIAGAMAGGLAEYLSMLLGFHGLVYVAIAFYVLLAVRVQSLVWPCLQNADSFLSRIPTS